MRDQSRIPFHDCACPPRFLHLPFLALVRFICARSPFAQVRNIGSSNKIRTTKTTTKKGTFRSWLWKRHAQQPHQLFVLKRVIDKGEGDERERTMDVSRFSLSAGVTHQFPFSSPLGFVLMIPMVPSDGVQSSPDWGSPCPIQNRERADSALFRFASLLRL